MNNHLRSGKLTIIHFAAQNTFRIIFHPTPEASQANGIATKALPRKIMTAFLVQARFNKQLLIYYKITIYNHN